jgi:hypothetical protein
MYGVSLKKKFWNLNIQVRYKAFKKNIKNEIQKTKFITKQ